MKRPVEQTGDVCASFIAIEKQHHRAVILHRRSRPGNEALEPGMESGMLAAGAAAVVTAIIVMLAKWLTKTGGSSGAGGGGGGSGGGGSITASIATNQVVTESVKETISKADAMSAIINSLNFDINVAEKDGKHIFADPTESGHHMKIDVFLLHRVKERIPYLERVVNLPASLEYTMKEGAALDKDIDHNEDIRALNAYLDVLEDTIKKDEDPAALNEETTKVEAIIEKTHEEAQRGKDIAEKAREILDDTSTMNKIHSVTHIIEAAKKAQQQAMGLSHVLVDSLEELKKLRDELVAVKTRCEDIQKRADYDNAKKYTRHSILLGKLIQALLSAFATEQAVAERNSKGYRTSLHVIETVLLVIAGMGDKKALKDADSKALKIAADNAKPLLEDIRAHMAKLPKT